MSRYYLLFSVLLTIVLTRTFATQTQGGLRFSGNEKLIVKENSVFRKILLSKKNRNYPLKIFKVIPFGINLILCGLVLLLYAVYGIFYTLPVGIAIGAFLNSFYSALLGAIWFVLLGIYIGIIQAI